MEIHTCRYHPGRGWDRSLPAAQDSERTLVLAFGEGDADEFADAFVSLREAFPKSVLSGCSSAGGILDENLVEGGLVVCVLRFNQVDIRVASVPQEDGGASRHVGEDLASLLQAPGLGAVLVLSDGLHVNGSQLILGLRNSLGDKVVITGGLAADGDRFQSTWVLDGSEVVERRVVAIGFYGDALGVSHGSRGGWDLLGPEREITRSADSVLYELDGQPALEVYKRYLGERAEGLPATALLFPLSVRVPEYDDEPMVRTVLAVDADRQSITFAGDVPQGSYATLMRANFDRLIDGASMAAEHADLSGYQGGDLLSIAISCVGRRLLLGPRTEEETEAVMEALPPSTRQVGFYSYGEISPLASGRCDLHNQTMTLTLLWECQA